MIIIHNIMSQQLLTYLAMLAGQTWGKQGGMGFAILYKASVLE